MKITLLTSPRTAGTYYGFKLAEQHNVPYLGEVFNQEISQQPIVDQVLNMEAGVCKVHADMNAFILNILLEKSDKTYFLIRKDIDAQVKSLVCARHRNPKDPWDPRSYDRTEDTGETIDIHVKQSEVDRYKEKITRSNHIVKKYSEVYNSTVKYTEDIILEDRRPYRQQYNLFIGD